MVLSSTEIFEALALSLNEPLYDYIYMVTNLILSVLLTFIFFSVVYGNA